MAKRAKKVAQAKPARFGKLRIAVIMGGTSDERAVSLNTGKTVLAHLDRTKYQPRPLLMDKKGEWRRKLSPTNTDLVFNALHGPIGEDGHVQGYLELLGLPYTGSGVAASAIGMDKIFSKIVFESLRLPVPAGVAIGPGEPFDPQQFIRPHGLPAVVKPTNNGSSIGVVIVDSAEALGRAVEQTVSHYGRALIERFVPGRELTVPVLGNERPRPLPVIEIIPKGRTFFDYNAKYTSGGALEETPATLPDVLAQQAQQLAVQAHKALGCRGYSRIDLRLTPANHFKILEINTLPGLTAESLLPKSAAAAGLTYAELLDEIIRLAV
ncbi:MAG: D-alanine--D-alanine ligase [Candidatus Andersenbacteria bacterium]